MQYGMADEQPATWTLPRRAAQDDLVDAVRDATAEVRAVDAALGRFMNQLDDAGLATTRS